MGSVVGCLGVWVWVGLSWVQVGCDNTRVCGEMYVCMCVARHICESIVVVALFG